MVIGSSAIPVRNGLGELGVLGPLECLRRPGCGGFDVVLREGLLGAPVLGTDESGTRRALTSVHTARTDTFTRYSMSAGHVYSG